MTAKVKPADGSQSSLRATLSPTESTTSVSERASGDRSDVQVEAVGPPEDDAQAAVVKTATAKLNAGSGLSAGTVHLFAR